MTQQDNAPEPGVEPMAAPDGAGPDELLTAALAAAQAQFPPIAKNHEAKVEKNGQVLYTYKYADLGDLLAAVRPVLAANGLAVVQRTVTRDGKVILITGLRHVAGGVLDSEVELGQSSSSPQQYGGALTYLRRYQAATLIGVAPEQDLDAQDVEPINPARNGQPPPAALPDWAKPVMGDARRKLIEDVAPLLGTGRAALLADALARRYDGLPDIAVVVLRNFAKAIVAEIDPLALEAAAARRDADTAQAAAEAPDTPAPEAEPTEEEAAAAHADLDAQAAAAAGGDVPFATTEELADTAGSPPEGPGVNTIDPPDIALDEHADPVKRIKALREAGCTCESPITVDHNQRDDACPIKGHGVPF